MNGLRRRILVVDDNPAIHADFKKILCPPESGDDALEMQSAALFDETALREREPSFEVDSAFQGEEGIERVRKALQEGSPYMMAFMDVRMPPGLDGIETSSRIWEIDPNLQIIICTAFSDYSWDQIASKLNHKDRFVVLKKPFDVIEVQQLANAFTEKWVLHHEIEGRTRKLQESEERYRFLANAMPGLVWTALPDGRVDYANQRLLDYCGQTFEQNRDWGWREIIHPEDLPGCFERWMESIRTGNSFEAEYRIKRACDGAYRWHLARAIAMRDGEGAILSWVGNAIDIDDQKKGEEELRQARTNLEKRVAERTQDLQTEKAFFEALLNSSLEGVLVVGDQGQKLLHNQSFVDMTKMPRDILDRAQSDEMLGYTVNSTRFPQQCRESVHYLVSHPTETSRDEIEFKDGTVLDRYTWPVVGTDGKYYGRIWSFRDITERKQAVDQLRLQTSALEAVANGILISDLTGKILWVNPAFTQLTGYSAEESIGKTPALLKSEVQGREFYSRLWNTILKGKCWRGELVNRHKDGTHYFEEMSVTPVLDQNGEIRNFVAVKHDVSRRKESERALSRERDLLQNLMDNLPDSIYFKDLQSRYVRINLAHARVLGLGDPKEAIGKSDADFFPGHFARQTFTDEQRIMATAQPMVDYSEEIRTLSGESIWVSSTKVPVRDPDGRVSGLVGVSRDITERKRVEEELRVQRESVRALTENAPDSIARIDRNLRFVYVNRVLEKTVGFPAKEIIGRTGSELGMGAADEWSKAIRRVFQTGQTTTLEFNEESREATRFLEARLVPEHSTFGAVLYVLAITRDITEHKKAEKQRQLMEVQLRQAQKLESIGQLAAGIAHEINTPTQYVGDNTRFLKESFDSITKVLQAYEELLASVKSNTATPDRVVRLEELLAATDLAYLFDQVPQAIKETLEGVERVTRIVRAMKEFSHPGGKEKSAADLNKAIETTVTVARNEWKYLADMVLDLDPSLPSVPCFVGEFNQVILNLVVNAAHAIGDVVNAKPGTKGTITVRTRRAGNDVEVRVTDTGTGIPEVHRSKIFEPFFTTKQVGKGTGQGLSIVYGSIVKKHGGTVSFETEVGKGTTFIVRLPIVPGSADAKEPAPEPQTAAAPGDLPAPPDSTA